MKVILDERLAAESHAGEVRMIGRDDDLVVMRRHSGQSDTVGRHAVLSAERPADVDDRDATQADELFDEPAESDHSLQARVVVEA